MPQPEWQKVRPPAKRHAVLKLFLWLEIVAASLVPSSSLMRSSLLNLTHGNKKREIKHVR